ncbi:MAG: TetR/AcrR family transcriptional regulator [Luminiphilus sp.]|nr:TetR/AcrR family transcriptional regulator [Luminiphilus sp.]
MTVKTSEHILDTTRYLFNTRGEGSVTASDVALELGISTGNLYYHFKGKEALHLALFAKLQREMIVLMGPAVQPPGLFTNDRATAPIETSWLFLTVVLEKMLEYRYVYDNPRGVMTRFDDVDRGFRRLLRMKQKVCNNIAEALIPASDSGAHQHLSTLTNTMTLCMNCWLSYDPLLNPQDAESLLVHRGVLQILSHCAPYLGDEQRDFYNVCEQLYQQMINEEAGSLD